MMHKLPSFFECHNDVQALVVIANFEIGDTIINYLVEKYEVIESFSGGVPAAGNGWHVYPRTRFRRAKKPYKTEVWTTEKLSKIVETLFDNKITEL